MGHAKLRLSQREKDIASNSSFILTKNRIISKTIDLLQQLQEEYARVIETSSMNTYPEISLASYKISRGENYGGFPWVVLDYPRYFDKKDIFAIRTMFWWGHFFSITLHLSGKWKAAQEKNILNAINLLRKRNFYLCISSDQWVHHFEKDNYAKLNRLTDAFVTKELSERSFIKLSGKYAIKEWEHIHEKLSIDFATMVKICAL